MIFKYKFHFSRWEYQKGMHFNQIYTIFCFKKVKKVCMNHV